ncbi:MAG: ATP-binding cassette domain-containing protein [Nevskiaceae bacterium]|nr:MAG: ATP-binding cassette domain-containing protein [Nevskiaceae bacterium]TBR73465.1 MAG: ATP-binding cassette domain-containing protein [Nevskiaceae bacterium]
MVTAALHPADPGALHAHAAHAPLLSVRNLAVSFDLGRERFLGPRRSLQAVAGVSFDVAAGETLGIVGESGCGKSTLARALLGLVPATGSVRFRGHELIGRPERALRPFRRELQIIFQDPLASLDPRMTVEAIVTEPLQALHPELGARQRHARAAAMLERVGLSAVHLVRYPHEFSGGQAQRIGIARALIVEPKVLVCDEPTSALDVSIKAQVINLLHDLQRELQLTLLFISHDLAIVRQIATRVLVLYLGRVLELADAPALYAAPGHPYTQALLNAIPDLGAALAGQPTQDLLAGEPPSPIDVPDGCVFHPRCPWAVARCRAEVPALRKLDGRQIACHRAEEIREAS